MTLEEIKNISLDELEEMERKGTVKFHHTSYFRGYVSRTREPIPIPYKGRFGIGYKLEESNSNSTTYSFVSYYIFTDQNI